MNDYGRALQALLSRLRDGQKISFERSIRGPKPIRYEPGRQPPPGMYGSAYTEQPPAYDAKAQYDWTKPDYREPTPWFEGVTDPAPMKMPKGHREHEADDVPRAPEPLDYETSVMRMRIITEILDDLERGIVSTDPDTLDDVIESLSDHDLPPELADRVAELLTDPSLPDGMPTGLDASLGDDLQAETPLAEPTTTPEADMPEYAAGQTAQEAFDQAMQEAAEAAQAPDPMAEQAEAYEKMQQAYDEQFDPGLDALVQDAAARPDPSPGADYDPFAIDPPAMEPPMPDYPMGPMIDPFDMPGPMG